MGSHPCNIVFYPAPQDDLPILVDQPDGRWFRVHSSTADRDEIPDDLLLSVANDAVCMDALRAGGHVWVREGA